MSNADMARLLESKLSLEGSTCDRSSQSDPDASALGQDNKLAAFGEIASEYSQT